MNFFEKWITNQYIKRFVAQAVDLIQGPQGGHRTELLGALLAVLLAAQGLTDVELARDVIELIATQITDVSGVTAEEARSVTLLGFILALRHRFSEGRKK